MEEIDTSSFKERIFSKTKFSMVIPEVEEQLKQLKIENIVLMGIEVSVSAPLAFIPKFKNFKKACGHYISHPMN